jgi:hypothetical protein
MPTSIEAVQAAKKPAGGLLGKIQALGGNLKIGPRPLKLFLRPGSPARAA